MTSLLVSIVHGINSPRCDSNSYGQPQPNWCTQLILKEIPIIGGLDRLFSLRTSIKPKGISKAQFSNRVELPFLRENDGCKIAFLAVRFLNGSISYDTSTWNHVRSEAQRLKRSCGISATAPLGGNLVVGDHSRLAIILYAPGSVYDDIVKADLAAGIVVVADEEPDPNLGATTGIVKPSSLSCNGASLALGDATSCNITEETVNVS